MPVVSDTAWLTRSRSNGTLERTTHSLCWLLFTHGHVVTYKICPLQMAAGAPVPGLMTSVKTIYSKFIALALQDMATLPVVLATPLVEWPGRSHTVIQPCFLSSRPPRERCLWQARTFWLLCVLAGVSTQGVTALQISTRWRRLSIKASFLEMAAQYLRNYMIQ